MLLLSIISSAQAKTSNDTKFKHWDTVLGAYTTDQWNLSGGTATIRADEAWEYTTGSSDVVVAVCDTGFDLTHEDLQNVWLKKDGVIVGCNTVDDKNVNKTIGQYGEQVVWPNKGVLTLSISPKAYVQRVAIDISVYSLVLGAEASAIIDVTIVIPLLIFAESLPDEASNVPIFELGAGDYQRHGTCESGIIGALTNNTTGIAGIAGGWYDSENLENSKPGIKIIPVKCWPDTFTFDTSVNPYTYLLDIYKVIMPATVCPLRAYATNDIFNWLTASPL